MERIKSQFRLPTKEELENLIDNHYTKWNIEKSGLEIMNKKGDALFLPACGYKANSLYCESSRGYYWSSTVHEYNDDYAYFFNISSWIRNIENGYKLSCNSVRLVSDEPFEGSVEFNGVYWKTKNEDGYFTFDEAIEKFG